MKRLLLPFVSSMVAKELRASHPTLDRAGIEAVMRADLGSNIGKEEERLIRDVLRKLPASESAAGASQPFSWASPSVLLLAAVNLVPLYGVVALGWPVLPLLALFWMENVVIGVLNAVRMLTVDPENLALWAGKLLLVPFFCVHYGLFTAAHGWFVFSVFGGDALRGSGREISPVDQALQAIAEYGLALPLVALAIGHLFSFFYNYLWRGEFRVASVTMSMMQPYSRVMVLHIVIIAGGIAAVSLGSPMWALIVLVALKLGLDLRAHIREHRQEKLL